MYVYNFILTTEIQQSTMYISHYIRMLARSLSDIVTTSLAKLPTSASIRHCALWRRVVRAEFIKTGG